MQDDQKRALLAVVLSGLVLFGWQFFFAPQQTKQAFEAQQQSSKTIESTEQAKKVEKTPVTSEVEPVKTIETTDVKTFKLVNSIAEYSIDSYLSVSDAKFYDSNEPLSKVFKTKYKIHSIEFLKGDIYKPTFFTITQISTQQLDLVSFDNKIKGTLKLNENGVLNYSLSSTNPIKYRFKFAAEEATLDNGSSRQFSYFTNEFDYTTVGNDDRGDTSFKWFGLDFNYHLFATYYTDKTPILYSITENGYFTLTPNSSENVVDFNTVYVRKDYDYLSTLGNNLQASIDFGMFSILSIPILRGLQFFFDLIPNYGISIILLTLIIRLLTFPLQYKSFKSMKKMQIIQPELQKVREKYKDNPQKMQQETMLLFKKAGANPLGGCLPLLLQMPIFFAFYNVLRSSVELVGAPFFGWIIDLSQKDPYYILPVAMAGAMFMQQKLTPTPSADPTQQKVMMFMPLIFGLIMKDLPSGLSLYIFVSTLFGMAQQLLVYRRVS
jgi:YidC/Oxa1 family membrane protein insertase